MMRPFKCALIIAVTVATACGGQAKTKFHVVRGSTYEGAIVPAELVPAGHAPPGSTLWTPSERDVADFEALLSTYAAAVGRDPAAAQPPVKFDPAQPPRDLTELRAVVGRLPSTRRHYFGFLRDERRVMLAQAIPDMPNFGNWRNELVGTADFGCGVWYAEIEIDTKRVLSFSCQGTA